MPEFDLDIGLAETDELLGSLVVECLERITWRQAAAVLAHQVDGILSQSVSPVPWCDSRGVDLTAAAFFHRELQGEFRRRQ